MRHSVTTPGGFFIGLGGIAASLFVAYAVYSVVRQPAPSNELRPQQIGLNLAAKEDANNLEKEQIRKATDELLKKAAAKYNNDKTPNLDNLDDLRGVVRYRESQKSLAAAHEVLAAPSNVAGLTVLEAAKQQVAKDILTKKVAASTVKVDLNPPAEKIMPPPLPNLGAGGVNNVVFPAIKPAAPAPAPAAPEAPKPAASAAPTPVVAVAGQPAAPNRPPLLNGTEPTK